MKKYIYPEIEVIKISSQEVIKTSGDQPGEDNKGDGSGLTPGEWWGKLNLFG